MANYRELFDFIKKSPTAYHAVGEVERRLVSEGYTELSEGSVWQLKCGGKYYVKRNGTSIIAFRNKSDARGYMICASHSDTPTFRLKTSEIKRGAYVRLDVEKYGGMILYSWLDRPLSVAGRALVRCDDGIEVRLVDIDRDLAVIPSLAIHLNRGVNDGLKLNVAVDMLPLIADGGADISVSALVAQALGVEREDIISHDLFLYNREEGRLFGADNDYILCPRLDDLGCVFSSLEGFLAAEESDMIPVLAVFDNEEVGSDTKQGAASTFLADTLASISADTPLHRARLNSSFMVSADNAHAQHPAHPELSDSQNAVMLGGGVAVKFNASQRYATDGLSDAVLRVIAQKASVRLQTYCNRADMPGGSTLGSISDTKVSIPTVDIGLPQLAMHSATESMHARDLDEMVKLLTAFFSTNLFNTGAKISIK